MTTGQSGSRASKRQGIRSEYKALTRQRLTDAALREFEDRGYSQCTVDDVARRAGTSRATFYVHFSGKAELAEGMWDVIRHKLMRLYRDLARAPVRDRSMIEAWLERTFAFYAENRQRLIAIHEAIALEPLLAEVYFERTEEVADFIAPLIEDARGVTAETARFRAALLTIQHERFCYFWILRGMPFDHAQAVCGLAEIWCDQIGVQEREVPVNASPPRAGTS
ncbi:TetR/AcrR family transcriptional regulator [Nocardioides sp.]|uniref:TetR/AcrR family transcriptional regulator n=1 Tax=Nocardioides sp. TaxID=35761 RepID=UPI003D145B5B